MQSTSTPIPCSEPTPPPQPLNTAAPGYGEKTAVTYTENGRMYYILGLTHNPNKNMRQFGVAHEI